MNILYLKKKMAMFLAILAASTTMAFADGYDAVYVKMNDGTAAKVIDISENLNITVEDSYVCFNEGSTLTFSAAASAVSSIEWIDKAGVNDLLADDQNVEFNGNGVCFSGLADNTTVTIYNLAGQQVKSLKVSGSYAFNFSDYAPGVYIVNINKNSYKVNAR